MQEFWAWSSQVEQNFWSIVAFLTFWLHARVLAQKFPITLPLEVNLLAELSGNASEHSHAMTFRLKLLCKLCSRDFLRHDVNHFQK